MDASASGVLFTPDETPERTAKSCGPDTRCWCQAGGNYSAVDGDKTNSLTGESTKYAVKPLRRGRRSVSAALYARVRQCANFRHTRPRVQRAPGIPCALCSLGGANELENSGKSCRENADVHPLFENW